MSMVEMSSPSIGDEEIEAVTRVMRSGTLTQGSEVRKFEESFSGLIGAKYGSAVNSGTSALHVGLLAAGVGPGDEVLVPSFTFAASANSIALTGAKPIFVDVDVNTFCIDPNSIRDLVNEKTKGIMPVHLYGNSADMDSIMKLACELNLQVYEDAAQAHGATHHDKPVGSFGIFGAFSFYPTKNITAAEAGMVVTSDSSINRNSSILRNQGMLERYKHEVVGFNYRLSEIHAAIGNIQITKLSNLITKRKSIASRYDLELRNVITPFVPSENSHVYHQYTIRIPELERDKVAAEMLKRGIRTGLYYPTPTHRQPAYDLHLDLPNTTRLVSEVLSIPVHPGLTAAEQDYVIETLNSIVSAGS
jgi:perosamine synthetase